ncbi:MAG TPA: hypothetical protein VGP26_14675 [Actinophytocola sp.]|jgi:hypothetical protein|nr:hypothetical protein [Actinophytocola sp.]
MSEIRIIKDAEAGWVMDCGYGDDSTASTILVTAWAVDDEAWNQTLIPMGVCLAHETCPSALAKGNGEPPYELPHGYALRFDLLDWQKPPYNRR